MITMNVDLAEISFVYPSKWDTILLEKNCWLTIKIVFVRINAMKEKYIVASRVNNKTKVVLGLMTMEGLFPGLPDLNLTDSTFMTMKILALGCHVVTKKNVDSERYLAALLAEHFVDWETVHLMH